MKDVNKVTLLGRLGADPILRETKSGYPVAQLSLATTRRLREADVEASAEESKPYVEETQWHRVTVWGKQGQACAQYLRKGSPVYVEGSIRSHQYPTDQGNRVSYEVHASEVSFLPQFKRSSASVLVPDEGGVQKESDVAL